MLYNLIMRNILTSNKWLEQIDSDSDRPMCTPPLSKPKRKKKNWKLTTNNKHNLLSLFFASKYYFFIIFGAWRATCKYLSHLFVNKRTFFFCCRCCFSFVHRLVVCEWHGVHKTRTNERKKTPSNKWIWDIAKRRLHF